MASEHPALDGQENTVETQEAVLVENRGAEWPPAEIIEQVEERDTIRLEAEGAGESNAESDEQETPNAGEATEDVGDATPGDEAEHPETGTELSGEPSPEMLSDDAFPTYAQGSTVAISTFTEVTEETPAGEPVAEAVAFTEEGAFATEVDHLPNAEAVEATSMEAGASEQTASTTEAPENAFEAAAAESSEETIEEEGTEPGDEATEEDRGAQAPGGVAAEGGMMGEAAEVTEEAPVSEEGEASNTGAEAAETAAEAEETLAAEEQAEGEAQAETLLVAAGDVFQEALSEISGAVETEEEERAEAEAGAAPEVVAEMEGEAAVEIEEAAEALTEAEVLVEAAVAVIAEAKAATEESAVGEAALEVETEAGGEEEVTEEPVPVAANGKAPRRPTSALILDQVLEAPGAAEVEGAAREPVTFVAHTFIAIGPNREPRVLVYHYHGRTGQPLHNVPVLMEASRAAHFFHQKATSGQTDGREVLVRIPEERIILIMADDGDVVSVHEEVARVIFPVIARQRAFWETEQRDIPAHHHEAPPALSFDEWA